MKEYVITTQQAGQRLDKYLKKVLPNASTGFLYKMLRKKNIVLNKKKATGQDTKSMRDRQQDFLQELNKVLKEEQIQLQEPMSRHTTFRVGGPAKGLLSHHIHNPLSTALQSIPAWNTERTDISQAPS